MELVEKFLVLAGLVYTVLQFAKPLYDQASHKWNFDNVAAVILGVVLAVYAKVGILAYVGVYVYGTPYIDYVLSGFLVGGAVGAGLIHDFPNWLKALLGKA